jgi:hypothetical protein
MECKYQIDFLLETISPCRPVEVPVDVQISERCPGCRAALRVNCDRGAGLPPLRSAHWRMNVPKSDLSRRSFLKAAAALGVVAAVRPLEQALAQMVEPASGQDAGWMDGGRLRYRRDGMAKVTGQKLFAIDLRARHGGLARQAVPCAFDHGSACRPHLRRSGPVRAGQGLCPDVLVDAERAEADGVHMPEPGFYGSYFLPKGQVSPMLGQPVALGIWHDYERYREAVRLLRFNEGIFQWGAAATPPSASPMWPRAMCAWEPTGMTSPICTRRCTTASCARS